MSDRRWFTWRSGRLSATPISQGWAPTLTARDPSIPNLPLESPAAAPVATDQIATVAPHVALRRGISRTLLRAPDHPTSAAPAENTSRALGASFQIKTSRSRRALSIGWTGALTAQGGAPAVVPAAAWFTGPRERRAKTERVLVAPEPLQWQYIAPTVAAILAPPRPKVIEFRRTLRLTPVHAVYPPPTGPPPTVEVLAAPAVTRRPSARRLLLVPSVPSYPASPPATSPATIAAIIPATAKRRAGLARRLLDADAVLGVAAAPGPVQTPITAVVPAGVIRRHGRPTRPLAAGVVVDGAQAAQPPEQAWRAPAARRVAFKRRLQRLADLLERPQTPAVGPQPEQAWRSKSVFRASQRRVLQAQAPQLTYPETPVAAPGNLPPLVGFVCNTGTLMGRW